MNKTLLAFSLVSLLFILSCAQQPLAQKPTPEQPTKCSYQNEEKSYIGKSAEECSRIKFMCVKEKEYFADECGCGCKMKTSESTTYPDKNYIFNDPEECKTIMFQCAEGNAFFDNQGCGCTSLAVEPSEGKMQAFDCTPEQKQAEICTMEYLPVCGWFDSTKIQCIKYPCAQNFGNICQACSSENVNSWTEGECPQ